MSGDDKQLSGPDLAPGISLAELPDGGQLLGHSGGEAVLVVRRGGEVFAIGATCTHYGGPLTEGIVAGDEVRCPWHHACFSLRTGEAVRPPALNPVTAWRVERDGDRVLIRERLSPLPGRGRRARTPWSTPSSSLAPAPRATAWPRPCGARASRAGPCGIAARPPAAGAGAWATAARPSAPRAGA